MNLHILTNRFELRLRYSYIISINFPTHHQYIIFHHLRHDSNTINQILGKITFREANRSYIHIFSSIV